MSNAENFCTRCGGECECAVLMGACPDCKDFLCDKTYEPGGAYDYMPVKCPGYEPCLIPFPGAPDDNEPIVHYQCGLKKGHDGHCAWRGDLPGGPILTIE